MRYSGRTALLDCALLVLILALFSIMGCGGGLSLTGKQAPVEQAVQTDDGDALPSSVPANIPEASSAPDKEATVAVPGVIGMSREEASSVLGGLGFQVSSGEDYSEKTAAGGICDQKPPAGNSAPRGSSVFIVVSLGTAWVTCSTCKGKGTVSEQYTCPECGGTGWCDS